MEIIPSVQVQVAVDNQKDVWLAGRPPTRWPDGPDLAQRREIMLAKLSALADEDQLSPNRRAFFKWFERQVRAASTDDRLDELVALFPESGMRRRDQWHRRPERDDDDGQVPDEPEPPEPPYDDVPTEDKPGQRPPRRRRIW